MVRQCAWCLCLIDINGERLSAAPLPKSYEATHGMCSICGALWIEQVLGAPASQFPFLLGDKEEQEQEEQIPERGTAIQTIQELPLHHI